MARRRTQRDVIRGLFAKHGDNAGRIFKGVVKAVERGEFQRERNAANQSLRRYVRFLLDAGKRTGWIYDRQVRK